jgi:hypothetical protein
MRKKQQRALVNQEGGRMSYTTAQRRIAETFRRTGIFILGCPCPPQIGEVQTFAGLPMRVVRYCTIEEALENHQPDLWGEVNLPSDDAYFAVEVAD